jgi:hypothetical protein
MKLVCFRESLIDDHHGIRAGIGQILPVKNRPHRSHSRIRANEVDVRGPVVGQI